MKKQTKLILKQDLQRLSTSLHELKISYIKQTKQKF